MVAGLALAALAWGALFGLGRLAAVVGGAFWGGLFAWRGTLVAPMVSHALWDLAVVVWFPFGPPGRARVNR